MKYMSSADVNDLLLISKDRALNRRCFSLYFPLDLRSHIDIPTLGSPGLWRGMTLIVSEMRKKPGATLDHLVSLTGLRRCEVRKCIKIIINLGGEVDLIYSGFEKGICGKFALYN